jgi:hypothetical protein
MVIELTEVSSSNANINELIPLIFIYFTNDKFYSFLLCYFQEQRSINMLHVTLGVAIGRFLVKGTGQ